jgi:hypothetical protein
MWIVQKDICEDLRDNVKNHVKYNRGDDATGDVSL